MGTAEEFDPHATYDDDVHNSIETLEDQAGNEGPDNSADARAVVMEVPSAIELLSTRKNPPFLDSDDDGSEGDYDTMDAEDASGDVVSLEKGPDTTDVGLRRSRHTVGPPARLKDHDSDFWNAEDN